VRGVDDEGHVANFVETEQLVYHDNAYTSFVQVRGTLPVFWNQSSAGGRGNVTLSRGFECSQRAFEKHCARLIRRYGRQMFINLLGCRGSDQLLTEAYKDHYDKCPLKKDIELVSFDYHSYIASSMKLEKMKPLLYKKTENFLQSHGLFHCLRNEVLCMQSGVLRTNCMDCLDRTNVTQMFHAMEMLHNQLCLLGIEEKAYQRFVDTFRSCWEKNGDNLSWIYAGSGALKKTSKVEIDLS
jgi:phosphatidylinositol-bisphosphatase